MLTYLLECVLTEENCPPESSKDLYELYFVFCCVWAFGGCLFQDQVIIKSSISTVIFSTKRYRQFCCVMNTSIKDKKDDFLS